MTHSDSSPLVTAVVLSYNKQSYLRSQLAYYAHKPIHLILADGSDTDWGHSSNGKIGQMTWEYFRMSGSETLFERMSEACQRVTTENMFFLDDEDCTLWTGVIRAVTFLQANPDYCSAGGGVAYTSGTKKRLGITTNSRYSPFHSSEDSAFQRVTNAMSMRKTGHLYYQVHRSEVVLNYARCLMGLSLKVGFQFGEVAFTSVLSASGKWKSDLYPYSLRRQFAGVVTVPKTARESHLTVTNAADLATRVFKALSASQCTTDETSIISSQEISDVLMRYYGSPRKTKSTTNQKIRQFIVRRILLDIFDNFPSIYKRLRPNGIYTIQQYSKLTDAVETSSDILNDLSALETLWLQYPKGLSQVEFENYLANN